MSPLRPHPGRTWCALRTRARHEKKVAATSEAHAIPCYLPLVTRRTFSGGKVNTFHLPMFAGYVFAALAPGDLAALKRTNSVAQRIEPRREQDLLRDLTNVSTLEQLNLDLETSPSMASGQRVIVVEGPLAGVTGVVREHRNRTRLHVMVEAIGSAVVVDVARSAVAPA